MNAETQDPFSTVIAPFMKQHCLGCHNAKETRGELDLSGQDSAEDVVRNFRRWGHIVEFIRAGAMPPEDAAQPSIAERQRAAAAIDELLLIEARKHAGDPGEVLPRRLSRTEYDHAIRDLTGVDIRPTAEFPVDPAGGEGFDNTGESLAMSPSLLKKHLAAADLVKSHLVLRTDGLEFAPFPVASYNERKKWTEQAIIAFYERHQVHLADYLRAAWEYRQRQDSQRAWTPSEWLSRDSSPTDSVPLSPRYLTLLERWLEAQEQDGDSLFRDIRRRWLDAVESNDPNRALVELRETIEQWQGRLNSEEGQMIRSNAGNWPIQHLHDRRKAASERNTFQTDRLASEALLEFPVIRKGQPTTLQIGIEHVGASEQESARLAVDDAVFTKGRRIKDPSATALEALWSELTPSVAGLDPKQLELGGDSTLSLTVSESLCEQFDGQRLLMRVRLVDAEQAPAVGVVWGAGDQALTRGDRRLLASPTSLAGRRLANAAGDFCRVFPNRFFYVDSRRGLAAGFHLVEGFFRDDQPLVQEVLNEEERQELSRLWRELRFVTNSVETLLRGFVWFERSERHVLHDDRFDFLRPEDPELITEAMLLRFERHYLERMNIRLKHPVKNDRGVADGDGDIPDDALLEPAEESERYAMIHGFFERIRTGLRIQRETLAAAEKSAHDDIAALAARAFRRPLRDGELASLRKLYDGARQQGASVEDAFRIELLGILMSPHFIYRYHEAAAGGDEQQLDDFAMASRLSFFLWSSIPDSRLLHLASSDQLRGEQVLVDELQRMTKDDRIAAFAREFFGQWLRYRDFLENDSVHAGAFPEYTDSLRAAMLEEPERLAVHLIQNDLPVTTLLNSDFTFVNEELAKHYGGAILRQYRQKAGKGARGDGGWVRVDGLREQGRGGLFGMAVVLAKNSAGERTSPVKRGFWTVHHLLGQHFPPPPADVPELPANEREAPATIRELLARHTQDARCAMCHKHFDGLGLAMEGFDPIGRQRTKDLAGRPVDNLASIGEQQMQGIDGLIRYVEASRRDDFVHTMCKKFLGYALGRSVMLSDRPLLDEMHENLRANDYRFSAMFQSVVRSRQFRFQRGATHGETR